MLQVLWDIAANIFASLISDLGGYGIGFATVITLGLIAAVHWHRQQVRKGNKGVQAWHLIAGGLAGITISSIVAFVGVILYFYYPLTSTKAEARLSNEPGAVITSGPTSSQGKSTVGQIIGTNPPRAVLEARVLTKIRSSLPAFMWRRRKRGGPWAWRIALVPQDCAGLPLHRSSSDAFEHRTGICIPGAAIPPGDRVIFSRRWASASH